MIVAPDGTRDRAASSSSAALGPPVQLARTSAPAVASRTKRRTIRPFCSLLGRADCRRDHETPIRIPADDGEVTAAASRRRPPREAVLLEVDQELAERARTGFA